MCLAMRRDPGRRCCGHVGFYCRTLCLHVACAASYHDDEEQPLEQTPLWWGASGPVAIVSIAHPGSSRSLETSSKHPEHVLVPAIPLPTHSSASAGQIVWFPIRSSATLPPTSPVTNIQGPCSPSKQEVRKKGCRQRPTSIPSETQVPDTGHLAGRGCGRREDVPVERLWIIPAAKLRLG